MDGATCRKTPISRSTLEKNPTGLQSAGDHVGGPSVWVLRVQSGTGTGWELGFVETSMDASPALGRGAWILGLQESICNLSPQSQSGV